MLAHEKICWKNPDRYCESCKNTGFYEVDTGAGYGRNPVEECYYCKQYEKRIAQPDFQPKWVDSQ